MQLYHEWLLAFISLLQVCVVQNLSGKLTRETHKVDIYKDIAKASGGWVVEVEKDIHKTSQLLTNMTIYNIEERIFFNDECSNPKFEFIIEKDTNLGYIIVNSRSNMKKVTITSPSGSTNDYAINANDESLFVGEIKNPPHGLWKVNVALRDKKKFYRAMVTVDSSLFLDEYIYDGDRLLEPSTLLTPGKEYMIHIILTPEIEATLTIKLFDERRNLLGKEISVTGHWLGFVCPGKVSCYFDGDVLRCQVVILKEYNDVHVKLNFEVIGEERWARKQWWKNYVEGNLHTSANVAVCDLNILDLCSISGISFSTATCFNSNQLDLYGTDCKIRLQDCDLASEWLSDAAINWINGAFDFKIWQMSLLLVVMNFRRTQAEFNLPFHCLF